MCAPGKLTAEHTNDGYIVPLKNLTNEVYSRDISRKINSASGVKQQRGEFIGSWAPYGYRKSAEDKHCLEPDPEIAPVLKDIFQCRVSGMATYCPPPEYQSIPCPPASTISGEKSSRSVSPVVFGTSRF